MAAALDKATIAPTAGSNGNGHAGVTLQNATYTTANTVAANSLIIQFVHRFRSGGGGTYTGTGGGLTWANLATPVTSGNIGIYAIAAIATSGLASGTTSFGVNATVNNNDYTMTAVSITGLDLSGGTVASVVRASGGGSAGTAAWGTGTIAGNSGDCYVGAAGGDGTLRTSTPDAGNTEWVDFNAASTSGSITVAAKLSGNASDSIDGDWSGTLTHVTIGAALKVAAGGGGVVVRHLGLLGAGT